MPIASFDLGAYGLGFLAGILSVLSPCVLPLLPIVLGSAIASHRFGAIALSLGLALSFVIVGLFVATIGFSIGLDGDLFRQIGAGLLLIFGLVMLFPALQARVTALLGRLTSSRLQMQAQSFQPVTLAGQFGLGILLGLVWSPCVGPTLGAAVTLAAQRQNLASVALMMLIFGIGASLPLLAIGLGLSRWQQRAGSARPSSGWATACRLGKITLGALLVLTGLLILSGHDRALEAALVDASPAWLTALTTRF